MKVKVWVDGGSKPHTDQSGAYAAVLEYGGKRKAVVGSAQKTTNNRMELMAAITAFKAIKKLINTPCDVEVVADSEYVVNGITKWVGGWKSKGWKTAAGKPVKNQDLWEELLKWTQGHKITWKWTRGHSDCEENNLCDKLCNEAVDKLRKKLLEGDQHGK